MMKEDLKEIILMGLGAISLSGEKASKLKKELLEKGENVYTQGLINNEELKRNIQEKIKENTNIQITTASKENIVDLINTMTDEEKEEIMHLLKTERKKTENDEK